MAFVSTSGHHSSCQTLIAGERGAASKGACSVRHQAEGTSLIAVVMLLLAMLLMATPALALLSLPAEAPAKPVQMLSQPTRFA
ncbi:MAG: hypothetical protein AB7E29_09960 [Xanthobacter sp.]